MTCTFGGHRLESDFSATASNAVRQVMRAVLTTPPKTTAKHKRLLDTNNDTAPTLERARSLQLLHSVLDGIRGQNNGGR